MKRTIFTLLFAILSVCTQFASAQTPAVEAELIEATTTTIKVKFTPNEATDTYHVVAYKSGEIDGVFESFAEMLEWKDYSDLVKSQGEPLNGTTEYLVEKVTPSTKRELWILPTDAEGKYGELQHVTFSTIAQGGDGEAKVEVKILDYIEEDEDQVIHFKPNDQTNYYLSYLLPDDELAIYYEGSIDKAVQYMISMDADEEYHPDMASYEEEDVHFWDTTKGISYTLITIGRNAKDEWGTADVKKFVAGTDETSINAIKADAANAQMFNIQGHKVNIPRGVIIKGGKKYFVK